MKVTGPLALFSFRFAEFAGNAHVWLSWAASQASRVPPAPSQGGTKGIPTHMSVGSSSPWGRNSCLLDKSVDLVTAGLS